MRDYALNHSLSHSELPGTTFVSRLIRNWRARRAVRQLIELDDRMLRDIGVSRNDVEWAAGVALTINAALALEERSSRARRRRP